MSNDANRYHKNNIILTSKGMCIQNWSANILIDKYNFENNKIINN